MLASVVLRKELAPRAPGEHSIRRLLAVLGVVGVAVTWMVSAPLAMGAIMGGASAALAALGMLRMSYATRALSVIAVAGSAMFVVLWMRLREAAHIDPLVVWLGVMMLSTALLFRAWHRGSLLARALVAVGIALSAGWLASHDLGWQMLTLRGAWQPWLSALSNVALCGLLLLSLLAFMDSRSTGACGLWSALLLAWYALHQWGSLLAHYDPQRTGHGLSRYAEGTPLLLLGPLFTAALCASLAQLLAIANAAPSE